MAHPRLTWGMLGLLTLLSVVLATRLRVDPNMLELLPPEDPVTAAVQAINKEEGGTNLLTIAMKGQDPEVLDQWMSGLAAELEKDPGVDYVLYEVEPELAWKVGILQLTPEELDLLAERLQGAVALGPAAANPFVASRLLDLGPLTARLQSAPTARGIFPQVDGIARMMVRPKGSAFDADFARPFIARVNDTIAAQDPAAHNIELVWLGGAYRHAVEDVEAVRNDLGWTGTASFVLVLIIIVVAFRDFRALVLIFVPLVLANIWTTGAAVLTVKNLNTFTSFYPAILFGLGVDFGIHLYLRYREQRAGGGEVEDCIARAWDLTGPPSFTAALTTVGGFCALWAAGFGGFQQLGTLLAIGVSFCFVSVLVTLPLLIRWREKRPYRLPRATQRAVWTERPPTYRLAPLGLTLAVVVTLGALTLVPRVQFEFDMSALRPKGLAYADLTEDQRKLATASYAPVIISYEDDASLTADHALLAKKIADKEFPMVKGLLSIRSVLPADQEARVERLRRVATLARDPNIVYLPLEVQKNLSRIAATEPQVISPADLPRSLQHMLGALDGRHRILLMPDGNMWDLRETLKMRESVEGTLSGRNLAGEYLALATLYTLVKDDTPRIAAIAMFLVFVLALLDLRHLGRALAAILALISGMIWAGAAMALFGVQLSVVNFVGIPILMGIGVDVVIHLLHRLEEEGPGRVREALATTGWASILSTLTTVASFAALILATHRGVQSLGMMIVLGLSLVTLSGFVLVPLGWMTTWKFTGRLPKSPNP